MPRKKLMPKHHYEWIEIHYNKKPKKFLVYLTIGGLVYCQGTRDTYNSAKSLANWMARSYIIKRYPRYKLRILEFNKPKQWI